MYPLEKFIENDINKCKSDQFAFISYSKLKNNLSQTVLDLLIRLEYQSKNLKELKIKLNSEQNNTSKCYVINLIVTFYSDYLYF